MTRAESKAATKERVRQAAMVEFTLYGYERTTMRNIAKRAGLSTGAIFASYPDKDALLRAAIPGRTGNALRVAETLAACMGVAWIDLPAYSVGRLMEDASEVLRKIEKRYGPGSSIAQVPEV